MVMISKLSVTNAKPIDATHWLTLRDVFGPQEISDASPRGDCVVQAETSPANTAAEWSQIAWSGGEPVPGSPNQRRVRRQSTATTAITASIRNSPMMKRPATPEPVIGPRRARARWTRADFLGSFHDVSIHRRCERSEAIQFPPKIKVWIASLRSQ